jgi:hypothetical protein
MANFQPYKDYTKSLEKNLTSTIPTGFLEFKPRDPVAQAKYSATSPSWEGIQSSEAAIARGEYDLDRAEKTREDLRAKKPQPKLPEPVKPVETCSVQ